MTTAEAIGQSGINATRALSSRPGTTAQTLEGIIPSRSQSAPDRLLDTYSQVSGIHPEDAQGGIDAFVQKGRAIAAPSL